MLRISFIKTLASLCMYSSTLHFSAVAGPVETQMQYSGSVEVISKTSVTIVTVSNHNTDGEHPSLNVNDIWPTSSVAGMNLEQLLSYEMGHNFELRPSTSTSSFNRHLTPDLPAPTSNTTLLTIPIPTEESSTDITTPFPIYLPTPGPLRRDATNNELLGNPIPENQPSQGVANLKECGGMLLNDWVGWKRHNNMELIAPPAHTDPAASHASYADMIYSMAAPYLPQNHHHRVGQQLRGRAAGANLPSPDPNAPYGAVVSSSGYALYTDKQAWDQAVYTWGQQGKSTSCLGNPPMFAATTKKQPTTPPPPGAVTTTAAKPKVVGNLKDKKMSNANGGGRFAKPVGDTTIGKRWVEAKPTALPTSVPVSVRPSQSPR